jgi:hypothetical protein
MRQQDRPERDAIDELLAAPQLDDGVGVFRQHVLQQTLGRLRVRRRLRRAAWAVGLAAGIAAIALGIHWLTLTSMIPQPEMAELPQFPQAASLPAPGLSALALEWRAFDSSQRQAELYRQAGDRYLTEGDDLQAALRCYGNALTTGTDDNLQLSPSDSWLLMAIKDARQKENRDANGM